MPEVFNHDEVNLIGAIRSKISSIEQCQEWINGKDKSIKETQDNLSYLIRSRASYQADLDKYTVELVAMREKLRALLTPLTPITMMKTLPVTATPEDCVDELEARSKSESLNAVTV
jgi:hypothetical protein